MSKFGDQHGILQHALRQAIANAQSKSIAKKMGGADAPGRDTEEAVKAWVALGNAMLACGKISATESVMFMTFAVEGIHNKRWLAGCYPELESLSAQMKKIEQEAGLSPEQYWKKGDAPEEYQRLDGEYEAALDTRFEKTLREFGLGKLADLWRSDPAEYDRFREIGRRSVFEKDNHLAAVSESINLYEDEAIKSAVITSGTLTSSTPIPPPSSDAARPSRRNRPW